MAPGPHNKGSQNYTSLPLEIVVVTLTALSFAVPAYFYHEISDRIPLFMNPSGEVAVWGAKSLLSVFRLPLLGLVFQVVLLLMKEGSIQFRVVEPFRFEPAQLQERLINSSVGLWDWFRWAAAFKMCSESVETVFLGISRFNFLTRPAFIVSVSATAIAVAGALFYLYRMLVVILEMKKRGAVTEKRRFNVASIRLWILIACVVAYLVLVFLPG